jgi:NADH-ubiquinone oxidoreductase chain 3
MLVISSFFLFSFFFSFFLLFVVLVLSDRYALGRVKMTPFECGFDPKESARLPFSVRFFLLAVVFLIFDIEVALLFPLVVGVKLFFYSSVVIAGLGFVFILIIGLLHEWREGALSWVS